MVTVLGSLELGENGGNGYGLVMRTQETFENVCDFRMSKKETPCKEWVWNEEARNIVEERRKGLESLGTWNEGTTKLGNCNETTWNFVLMVGTL